MSISMTNELDQDLHLYLYLIVRHDLSRTTILMAKKNQEQEQKTVVEYSNILIVRDCNDTETSRKMEKQRGCNIFNK